MPLSMPALSFSYLAGERLAAENAELISRELLPRWTRKKRGRLPAHEMTRRSNIKFVFVVNGVYFVRRVLIPRLPRFPRL